MRNKNSLSTMRRELRVHGWTDPHIDKIVALSTQELDQVISKRGHRASLIQKYAHNGRLLVLESGCDCDCVEYSGSRHTIAATPQAYDALQNDISKWADGPFRLQIAPWDTEVEYESHSRFA